MVEVIGEVSLGFVIFSLILNIVCFLIMFGYISQLNQQISIASSNFQQSNESVAEAIVSIGSLLDDLDEVSGDLIRPPAVGDVLAQGLQMFMMSKLQNMLPDGMPAINEIINSQRVPEPEIWQEVNQNQSAEVLSGQTGTVNVGTQIGENIKKNGLMAVGALVLIKVAQKAVVGLGVNRSINKLSDSVGLGSTVRAN